MLSTKIDLTERQDFSSGFGGFVDFEVSEDVYDGLMTSEQYKSLCIWESIFGKRRHENRKRHIFPVKLSRYNTKCARCRKELRIPWMRQHGLCQDCAEKESQYNSRIPWKSNIVSAGRFFDDKGYRLFNSK